jgi:hypothetical protein
MNLFGLFRRNANTNQHATEVIPGSLFVLTSEKLFYWYPMSPTVTAGRKGKSLALYFWTDWRVGDRWDTRPERLWLPIGRCRSWNYFEDGVGEGIELESVISSHFRSSIFPILLFLVCIGITEVGGRIGTVLWGISSFARDGRLFSEQTAESHLRRRRIGVKNRVGDHPTDHRSMFETVPRASTNDPDVLCFEMAIQDEIVIR